MTPRGIRNNNPLNIRHNTGVFRGEIKGKDKTFKTFSTMPYGYRAAFVILATYLSKDCNTIEKIITRWAPPSENNTQAYIAKVEKWSGVPKDKVLTAADGADYMLIVAAMSAVENGINADINQVKEGFALQNKIAPVREQTYIGSTLRVLFVVMLFSLCSACKTKQYIPVETVKTEYRDKIARDSIFRYDSVFVKQTADTVFFERYRYLYKDKIVRDSIFVNDTIRVPYPVKVVKEVKAPLSGWQNFQLVCGRIALALALFAIIYFGLKLKKSLKRI